MLCTLLRANANHDPGKAEPRARVPGRRLLQGGVRVGQNGIMTGKIGICGRHCLRLCYDQALALVGKNLFTQCLAVSKLLEHIPTQSEAIQYLNPMQKTTYPDLSSIPTPQR